MDGSKVNAVHFVKQVRCCLNIHCISAALFSGLSLADHLLYFLQYTLALPPFSAIFQFFLSIKRKLKLQMRYILPTIN